MNETTLGLVAGAITTAAAIPQVVKTFRTKQARDLSIWQPVFLIVGMTLWLLYGIALGDVPLIVANSVSLACYILLVMMKIRYREGDKKNPDDYLVVKDFN